jgi:predicted O-methyltransferase YrrM
MMPRASRTPIESPIDTPRIDLRTRARCDADFLLLISGAHVLSSAVFTAVELGVFEALESGARLGELVAQLAASERGLESLLVLLRSLGLVKREPDGTYRNESIASDMLTTGGSASLRSFILHQQRHVFPLLRHLSDAVRSGEPQTSSWTFGADTPDKANSYTALLHDHAERTVFLEAMNIAAAGVGQAIARAVDFGKIRTLADFGGGGGQIAVELAQVIPLLEVTIVDRPEACRYAEDVISANGLADRVRTVASDFLRPLPADVGTFDAVLLGGVLADWDAQQRTAILRNAWQSLEPDGLLLVSETLLDDDKAGPMLPAMLSLMMLVAMRGQNFTGPEVVAMLHEAGFTDISVTNNRHLRVRDLVVGKKPRAQSNGNTNPG